MNQVFANLFEYAESYTYSECMFAFSDCKLTRQITFDTLVLPAATYVDEILLNIRDNYIKMHIDDKIYKCSFNMNLSLASVKDDTETDTDFEEENI